MHYTVLPGKEKNGNPSRSNSKSKGQMGYDLEYVGVI